MRRGVVVVALVMVALPLSAAAAVTEDDVVRAAAELEQARAHAGDAGVAFAAAREETARLRVEIDAVVGSIARNEILVARGGAAAAVHLVRLYVNAVAVGPETGAGPVGSTQPAVRAAYAAAIADRDRAVVNGLRVVRSGLGAVEARLHALAAQEQEAAARLEAAAGAAGVGLAAAQDEYDRVRAAWEREVAARRAAAATTTTMAATTTTTPMAATTTTTPPPPDSGGSFPAAVERWRPLVVAYFPPGRVDAALSVMWCESCGDPEATNPLSGAAGLFQHVPRYWPERATATGFPGSSPYDGEANIAAAAWLVRVSIDAGLSPWYFWVCKP